MFNKIRIFFLSREKVCIEIRIGPGSSWIYILLAFLDSNLYIVNVLDPETQNIQIHNSESIGTIEHTVPISPTKYKEDQKARQPFSQKTH